MADTFKYRIDHHGSLVRPAEVLAARQRHADGELDDAGLRAAEDAAIADVVRRQRKRSLTVVTDGEFRRADIRSAVFDAVHGFSFTDGRWVAVDELKAHRSLVAEDVAGVAALTKVAAKATLPSPAWLAAQTFDATAGSPYGSARELGEALAKIINEELEQLIAHGIRLVQIDNHGYADVLDGGSYAGLSLEDAIAIDSQAVQVSARPEGFRIGICPTTAAGEASLEVARRLFSAVPVDRWILPYAKGTAGEELLLRAVPAGKDVCLGIVDPARAELEDVDEIMDRMDLAGTIRDLEDVAISPIAGFSPVAGESALSVEDQWRKLVHVETIARMTWGNEL
jgi:5-methyltetrahydropteroyltriglutamate--homocysteine methyltransferase